MCDGIIHTIKETMRIDNINIIIYCLRKTITQISSISELIENFLSTNHNQGTIEIIIIWGVKKYKIKRELELLNRNRKF